MEHGAPATVVTSRRIFRAGDRGAVRTVRARLPVDVARVARPRKLHPGKETKTRRASNTDVVREQLRRRARCGRKPKAFKETLDRTDRRYDRVADGGRCRGNADGCAV